jgi:hypothetical protein
MGYRLLAVIAVAIVSACLPKAAVESPATPRVVTLTGLLTTIWGDPKNGSPQLLLELTGSDGKAIPLEISDTVLASAGGLGAVNNRLVEISAIQTSAGTSTKTHVQSIRVAHESRTQ